LRQSAKRAEPLRRKLNPA